MIRVLFLGLITASMISLVAAEEVSVAASEFFDKDIP